ncbi:MAG: DNA replication and repair protein RecF [Saprospiraceae bacterium]|nr:DNA replication and repair protein RecF [Saprospiraceae bacterium]MBK9631904.1 DNA replication and repair protein RecF [Saprospiraceae bacterium]
MILGQLELLNYKNLESISLQASPRVNFIIGANGIGKTNLLDCIYYTGMTRSYFSSSDKLICRKNQNFFRIEGQYFEQSLEHQLVVKVAPGSIKEFEWDGYQLERATEHIGRIPVVFVSPDDIFSFIQESSSRRSFLDQSLVQVDADYLRELTSYNRLLKQRSAILKLGYQQGLDTLLDSYDLQMIEPANAIYQKRKAMVEALNPLLNQLSLLFSGEEQSSVLKYQSDAEENLFELWKTDRMRDKMSGRVNSGIHRDKLIPEFNHGSLKEFGSQGQIKTFILALRIAQYEYLNKMSGMKPILLLDELFAQLDGQRVEALIKYLASEHTGQCFITDNYLNRAVELKDQIGLESCIFELRHNELHIYEKNQ